MSSIGVRWYIQDNHVSSFDLLSSQLMLKNYILNCFYALF